MEMKALTKQESDQYMNLVNLSDDLKSNFRSWEIDCDNEEDAYALVSIISRRHPKVPYEKVVEECFYWVEYDGEEDEE